MITILPIIHGGMVHGMKGRRQHGGRSGVLLLVFAALFEASARISRSRIIISVRTHGSCVVAAVLTR